MHQICAEVQSDLSWLGKTSTNDSFLRKTFTHTGEFKALNSVQAKTAREVIQSVKRNCQNTNGGTFHHGLALFLLASWYDRRGGELMAEHPTSQRKGHSAVLSEIVAECSVQPGYERHTHHEWFRKIRTGRKWKTLTDRFGGFWVLIIRNRHLKAGS